MDRPRCEPGFTARLKSHWRKKLVGSLVFIALFFIGYFLTLKFPVFPVTRMPATALDRAIGFHPAAMALYVSLWFYVLLAPALIWDKSELFVYGVAASGLAVAGLAIFFFWPTVIPDPGITWARYPGFASLKSIDASGNACPSLHVAFAVFTGCWIHRMLRGMSGRGILRVLSWCWCLGILYSTLATKQHVVVDLLAGAPLGWLLARPRGHLGE
jgi:membrane-associated phospholipid phosphatase